MIGKAIIFFRENILTFLEQNRYFILKNASLKM